VAHPLDLQPMRSLCTAASGLLTTVLRGRVSDIFAKNFVSDPEVPPIMKEAGHKEKPVAALLAARCDA